MRNSLCFSTESTELGMGHTIGVIEEDQAQIFSSVLRAASRLEEKP